MSTPAKRPLPMLTDSNRFFWTSGADGKLRFLRCTQCQNYLHPPVPVCDKCLCREQEVVGIWERITEPTNQRVLEEWLYQSVEGQPADWARKALQTCRERGR